MWDTTTVTFRTNKLLKQQAQEFFDSIWVNMSSAFNLFLNDIVTNRKFTVSVWESGQLWKLYPVEYDELTTKEQKTVDRLRAWDTNGFVPLDLG